MKKVYFYLIGLALLIISFFLDKSIANFFVNNRVGFLDSLSIFINVIEGYVLFLFVLVVLIAFRKKNKILPLLLAFVLYLGLTQIIKVAVARPRPFTWFDFGDNFTYFEESGINRSFPSGHATAAASLIRFFEFHNVLFWIWIAITFLVMFSRVYLGMHYLSDVVAGFVLGYFISDFSIFLAEKLKR